jgi:hypothetical protein
MSDKKRIRSQAVWNVLCLEGSIMPMRRELDNQELDLAKAKLNCLLDGDINMELPGDREFVENFLLEFANREKAYVPRVVTNDDMQMLVEKLMSVYRLSKADSARQYWYVFIARDGVDYQVELMLAIDGSSSAITVKKQPQKHVKEDDK